MLANAPTIQAIIDDLPGAEKIMLIPEGEHTLVPADYHDRIEFSASLLIQDASKLDTPDIEAQIHAAYQKALKPVLTKHTKMRQAWLTKQQTRKKQFNYYRWLVLRLINKYSIKYIADVEPVDDAGKQPDEATISHGVREAAAHLGIHIPKFRGTYPK